MFTIWNEKTAFFVLVVQNLIIPSRQVRCEATNLCSLQSIHVEYLSKVGDLETSSLLTSWCHRCGRYKPAFSILEISYKNSISRAKNCTTTIKISMRLLYYAIEYFFKQRVLKLFGRRLLLIVWRKTPTAAFTGLAYQILKNVAVRVPTQPKFTERLVCYIFNTPLKWKLMKHPSDWAVSLARWCTFLHGALEGNNYFRTTEDLATFRGKKTHCVVYCTHTCWRTDAVRLGYIPTWSNLRSNFSHIPSRYLRNSTRVVIFYGAERRPRTFLPEGYLAKNSYVNQKMVWITYEFDWLWSYSESNLPCKAIR